MLVFLEFDLGGWDVSLLFLLYLVLVGQIGYPSLQPVARTFGQLVLTDTLIWRNSMSVGLITCYETI